MQEQKLKEELPHLYTKADYISSVYSSWVGSYIFEIKYVPSLVATERG